MKMEISFRDSVKEAIAIALIQLMKERDISHITIQDIVKRAGVGRSSFYRNFESKEDILVYYINLLFDVTEEKTNPFSNANLKAYITAQFRLYKENKDFFVVLQKNNLLHLLYQQSVFHAKQNIAAFDLYRNPYQAVFFSSAAVGVTIQWIENDFKESEEELTEMFIYLMDGHHRQRK